VLGDKGRVVGKKDWIGGLRLPILLEKEEEVRPNSLLQEGGTVGKPEGKFITLNPTNWVK